MFFSLFLSLVYSLSLPLPCFVLAQQNVTVDDSNEAIQYSSGWSVSTTSDSLDIGGYHHLTDSTTAFASLTFTGTAVFFYGPKWPYAVGAQVAVDSDSSTFIDLRDYSQNADGGPETISSSVVWSQTGMANTKHTLQITFPTSVEFLIVDAIMYTTGAGTSSSSSSSSLSSSSASATNTSSVKRTSVNGLAVGLGVGMSVAGLALMGALAFFFLKRRRQRKQYPTSIITGGSANSVSGFTGRPPSSGPTSMSSMYATEPFVMPDYLAPPSEWAPVPAASATSLSFAPAASSHTGGMSEKGFNPTVMEYRPGQGSIVRPISETASSTFTSNAAGIGSGQAMDAVFVPSREKYKHSDDQPPAY